MARLLLFGAVREAAGCRQAEIGGTNLGDVLAAASSRFGSRFDRMLASCAILVDDEPVSRARADRAVRPGSTVAILPPVSGGGAPPGSLRVDLIEANASLGDLGTFLPLAAGLVLINGVDPVAAFGVAGLLSLASGLAYRVPVPVQPIKAAAAIAIATGASAGTIAAAGLILGGVLLLLAVTGTARLLERFFSPTVIRGVQLGVGILLLKASIDLAGRGTGSGALALLVAGAVVLVSPTAWPSASRSRGSPRRLMSGALPREAVASRSIPRPPRR